MQFNFINPNRIEPEGWMKKQLETQANGLCGNLDKVWDDVKDSQWLGGSHEGWERLPYFLDGFIPLAYLLHDKDKIARAKKYVSALMADQADDGCFYPVGEKKIGDVWSLFLIAKVLVVYAECSGEREKTEESLIRLFDFLDKHFDRHPPFEWAAARWYECIIPLHWLYCRTREEKLVRFTRRLKALGTDFEAELSLLDRIKTQWNFETHVVNLAMSLKSEALYCEMTGETYSDFAGRLQEVLFRYHGTAYGHFTGDECLSGTSPIQGSELCGIVEAMYSYEWLIAVTGESKWGDALEKLAFNGLPAAISADMWGHQYDQQVNQIACTKFERQTFRTNNDEANIFGLEPHFGCCTANFGQGFPKFMLSAYMERGDQIVVNSPLPAEISLKDDGKLICKSEYPFRKRVVLTATKTVKILYRLPIWGKAEISVEHRLKDGWAEFTIEEGGEAVITYDIKPILKERPDGRKCAEYGALLFALPVEYETKIHEYIKDGVERKFPYCDYTFLPTGEWRYAFASDVFEVQEREYNAPFDRKRPPVVLKGKFAPVEWAFEDGFDLAPAVQAGRKRRGRTEEKVMFPYGATYLRMTEMMLIQDEEVQS